MSRCGRSAGDNNRQPDFEPVIAAAPDESSEPAPASPRAAPAQDADGDGKEDVSYVQPDFEPVCPRRGA